MHSIEFDLRPVPPFRLDLTVWAIRRRPDNLIDRWDGTTYRRLLIADDAPLELSVIQTAPPEAPCLHVRVEGSAVAPAILPEVTEAINRLLGLQIDLTAFYQLAARDPRLDELATRFRGLKPPRFPTIFEALVNAVACQQITLTQGIRLLNRLAEARGPAVPVGEPPFYALPGPAELAPLEPWMLRGIGFSLQRAQALVDAGRAVVSGALDLATLANLDDAAATARLRELYGVGRWSAEYVLLRGLGRLEIFPADDVGARKSLQLWLGRSSALDYTAACRAVADWSPFAGLVYFHLLLSRLATAGYLSAQDRPAGGE
ncbi:MAG TPA: DNA-3-methyladenine glycosylase 2 family protein [Chloroflexota bacterium]|nr:DNA-3-methyladenine glycosylase 2 family protein [Chloroflexota bacterium]